MTSIILLFIGCCLLGLGGLLSAFAKSGPQETLGGVMISFGILAAVIGGGLVWLGL